jgi:hypothetical protein
MANRNFILIIILIIGLIFISIHWMVPVHQAPSEKETSIDLRKSPLLPGYKLEVPTEFSELGPQNLAGSFDDEPWQKKFVGIRDIITAFNWVVLYYNKSMFTGSSYVVKACIEPKKGSSLPTYYVPMDPEYKVFNATPGLKYKLALTGTVFDISLENGIEAEQIFSQDNPAIWVWNVIPQVEGKHNMTLTVYLVISGYEAKMIADWPVVIEVKAESPLMQIWNLSNDIYVKIGSLIVFLTTLFGLYFHIKKWEKGDTE